MWANTDQSGIINTPERVNKLVIARAYRRIWKQSDFDGIRYGGRHGGQDFVGRW